MKFAKEKQIIPPKSGWKDDTYYIVDVSFSKNNPVHRLIFFSGFLNKGIPCGYNQFGFTEDFKNYSDVYYMRVIREIDIDD